MWKRLVVTILYLSWIEMWEQLNYKCFSLLVFQSLVFSYNRWSCSQRPRFPWANRGRHLRVVCKKGQAYDKIGEVQRRHAQDKKGEQKCFQLLDSKESKQMEQKSSYGTWLSLNNNCQQLNILYATPKINEWHQKLKRTSCVEVLICAKEGH